MSHSTIFSFCRLKTDKFSYVSQLQYDCLYEVHYNWGKIMYMDLQTLVLHPWKNPAAPLGSVAQNLRTTEMHIPS